MPPQTPHVSHPSFAGLIGVARRDITPPLGIYSRMWGSALHDTAEAIHRPLTATALAFRSSRDEDPLLLIALDLGWWRTEEDERFIRGHLLQALALDPARLMVHLSHTHAGPCISFGAADKPGGDKIEPYMRRLRDRSLDAAREAIDQAQPATLAWSTGRCDLAHNRQWPDPTTGRVVVGLNPHLPADDTLLVGRVTDHAGRVTATLVNYACHPTTLGGSNRHISPDYVGAMREVVEQATGGAPCLFLHGASGELGPRRQYVGNTAIADGHGRQLGHAAVGVIHGMLPHGKALAYAGVERSGAELGRWDTADRHPSTTLWAEAFEVELPVKQLPPMDELSEKLRACKDRILAERLERALMLRTRLGEQTTLPLHVWVWRLGDTVLLGTPSEAHSPLQTELRRRFPDLALAVMNIVNGYISYLPPAHEYRDDSYQAQVALFDRGGLEKTIQACDEAITRRLSTVRV